MKFKVLYEQLIDNGKNDERVLANLIDHAKKLLAASTSSNLESVALALVNDLAYREYIYKHVDRQENPAKVVSWLKSLALTTDK